MQPLIRYDLGDQVQLRHELCECGSAFPIMEVLGRRDDAMVMAALARCRAAQKKFADVQELMPISLLCELDQAMPRGRSGKAKRIVASRTVKSR